jgi:uncharacterized protein YcgL (UPF0745 family)
MNKLPNKWEKFVAMGGEKMSKRIQGVILLGALLLSFGLGFGLAQHYRSVDNLSHKPVPAESRQEMVVNQDTPVVLEKVFTECGHVVTGELENRKNLVGKTLEEIRQQYPYKEGYLAWFNEDKSLVIHQRVEGWCPEDDSKCHLGVYKDHVAVYRGPAGYNEEILRITRIKIDSLPTEVREEVRTGKMEFTNETTLNDALESLDEYE